MCIQHMKHNLTIFVQFLYLVYVELLINLIWFSKFQELQSMNIVPRLKLADA